MNDVLIVFGTLLLITKNIICRRNFSEFLLCIRLLGSIGVILLREGKVCLLNCIRICILGNTKNLIIISLALESSTGGMEEGRARSVHRVLECIIARNLNSRSGCINTSRTRRAARYAGQNSG